MTSIGERIRARRLLRGWSIRHAASRAGLSHTTWSRIERGRQAADNRFVLAEIAAALECAPSDLAGMPAPASAERSREAAEAAESPVLRGLAAIARASAASACGSYGRSLTLASTAADDLRPHLAERGGPETLGLLMLVCADASRGLERLGDSRDRGARAVELAGRTEETDTMGLFFGPTNVTIRRIGIEVDGEDAGRAAEIARDANPLRGLCERMGVGR